MAIRFRLRFGSITAAGEAGLDTFADDDDEDEERDYGDTQYNNPTQKQDHFSKF